MIPEHPCWEWVGATISGYGHFGLNGRYARTHRYSWELHYGSIPAGIGVLHQCDNPLCVRPDHLFLGTQSDNMRDMHAKRRGNNRLRNGKAGLTENDVISILDELCDGRSQRTVSRKFGVSQTLMWALRAGKVWKILPS